MIAARLPREQGSVVTALFYLPIPRAGISGAASPAVLIQIGEGRRGPVL